VSFRTRLTLASALAVGLAVVVASAVVFVLVRNELRSQTDKTLRDRAAELAHTVSIDNGPGGAHLDTPPTAPGIYVQIVTRDGRVVQRLGETTNPLPRDDRVMAATRGQTEPFFSGARILGRHVRILTAPGPGYAFQVALDDTDVARAIHRIGVVLILIALAGIAVATGLGLVVARAALAPVRRLTATTERVTDTGDLSERIEVTGHDELSRLATSFNSMLAALEESSRAQRQLVADASHELRTPLTSLRTNIEVLLGGRELKPGDRDRLLNDVVEQTAEMTALISELIELARGEQTQEEPQDVRLDQIAADAVERTQRNRPSVTFVTDLEESLVHGAPGTIERAIANLLDNAAKWSPDGAEVEVGVRDGEVSVRDHGPGIAEEDLPYVFDRFYRARSARGLPGSGLGLAIVKQVADAHGGQVVAERAEGGGTRMRLLLNGRGSS
jgi:two-component system, OmpR family, sensor histidine kinase MprB